MKIKENLQGGLIKTENKGQLQGLYLSTNEIKENLHG
jgi:hypothetical protein